MSVEFVITKSSDPEFQSQLTFDQEVITIGRDSSNSDVYLPDELKVVGRQHAKIEQTPEGYQLVDVGTKNFTFLNGDRIKAGQPYPLKNEDQIKCGNFILDLCIQVNKHIDSSDATVIIENPFEDVAQDLGRVLGAIYEKYDIEAGTWKKEALQLALWKALRHITPNEAEAVIVQHFHTNGERHRADDAESSGYGGPQVDKLLDTLLETITKMFQRQLNFKSEFLDETILRPMKKSPDHLDLYSCTHEEMKTYLLDDALAEEDRHKRQNFLRKALESLMRHQVAILKGYRHSVSSGSKTLLQKLAPDSIRNELSGKRTKIGRWSISLSTIPFFFRFKFYRLYLRRHKKMVLDASDENYIQKRIFAPNFIEAYRNSMEENIINQAR